MKETLIRTATGILFVGILIAALLLHPWFYVLLFSLILLLAWWEWTGLLSPVPVWLKWSGGLLLSGSFVLLFMVLNQGAPNWMLPGSLLPAGLILLYDVFKSSSGRGFLLSVGSLYILAGFSAFHLLAFQVGNSTQYQSALIIVLLVLLWTYDTMAYVCGRLLGKHAILPSVSPSKTWEGLAGGLLFSMIAALVLWHFVGLMGWISWIGLALVISLGGTAGDFLESAMKRKTGTKDSGRLLPGHGGILDRFDSAMLATPLACLYFYIFL